MADIIVEATSWNGLSPDERDQITEIMRETGLIQHDDDIVPGIQPTVIQYPVQNVNTICLIQCNNAEVLAIARCNGLGEPAKSTCIRAAHNSAIQCRIRCSWRS
jgi:hypothetical protein